MSVCHLFLFRFYGNLSLILVPTVIYLDDCCYNAVSCIQEIFGPVLTIYVYKDSEVKQALKLVDTSTEFALTGSIFASDQ